MVTDVKSIEKWAKMLATNLHFKIDYQSFGNSDEVMQLLIVEGQTDEEFIKEYLVEGVCSLIAWKAFGSRGFGLDEKFNAKRAIVEFIEGFSKYTQLIKFPEELDKWQVFGMVDKDFEEDGFNRLSEKLFVTDTHDLETLLLKTDVGLLERLDDCEISTEEVKKAFFIAYQLGVFREIIKTNARGMQLSALSAGGKTVNYDAFVLADDRVSLALLMQYINDNSREPLSTAKLKKTTDRLCKEKSIKKYVDNNGCWKQTLSEFDPEKTNDFWNIVNGHDVLSLIKYQNETANILFSKPAGGGLDRAFEMKLIEKYNRDGFYTTDICSKMIRENVVVKE